MQYPVINPTFSKGNGPLEWKLPWRGMDHAYISAHLLGGLRSGCARGHVSTWTPRAGSWVLGARGGVWPLLPRTPGDLLPSPGGRAPAAVCLCPALASMLVGSFIPLSFVAPASLHSIQRLERWHLQMSAPAVCCTPEQQRS